MKTNIKVKHHRRQNNGVCDTHRFITKKEIKTLWGKIPERAIQELLYDSSNGGISNDIVKTVSALDNDDNIECLETLLSRCQVMIDNSRIDMILDGRSFYRGVIRQDLPYVENDINNQLLEGVGELIKGVSLQRQSTIRRTLYSTVVRFMDSNSVNKPDPYVSFPIEQAHLIASELNWHWDLIIPLHDVLETIGVSKNGYQVIQEQCPFQLLLVCAKALEGGFLSKLKICMRVIRLMRLLEILSGSPINITSKRRKMGLSVYRELAHYYWDLGHRIQLIFKPKEDTLRVSLVPLETLCLLTDSWRTIPPDILYFGTQFITYDSDYSRGCICVSKPMCLSKDINEIYCVLSNMV